MTVMLAILPYPTQPLPHSVEKIQMLMQGNLSKPLDIFDLIMHTGLIVLVIIKFYGQFIKKNVNDN